MQEAPQGRLLPESGEWRLQDLQLESLPVRRRTAGSLNCLTAQEEEIRAQGPEADLQPDQEPAQVPAQAQVHGFPGTGRKQRLEEDQESRSVQGRRQRPEQGLHLRNQHWARPAGPERWGKTDVLQSIPARADTIIWEWIMGRSCPLAGIRTETSSSVFSAWVTGLEKTEK